MVTYASLPSKSVDASPTYFYSESSGGSVVKTLTAPYVTITGTQTLTNKTLSGGTTLAVVSANTGTSYTIDYSSGALWNLTLTGNCVYTFPTATAGRVIRLIQKQDGTGSRTVTWGAAVRWPGGTAPTLTSTANRADMFEFTADGTVWYGRTLGQNFVTT